MSVIAPVTNHREREKGMLVYPVYSRRSGGLSIGINLFPDKKHCSFDCPYCEIFPFSKDAVFSPGQMEVDLRSVILTAQESNIPIKDICFSGNGEPTLSANFSEALEIAGRIRDDIAGTASMVLITNGTGLMTDRLFSLLKDAASGPLGLDIWLKLDAGTPEWYKKINRSVTPHELLIKKIKQFVSCAPVTIQAMLCAVDGMYPPPEEDAAWEKILLELITASGIFIRKVQIYGKARPAPEDPKCSALPAEYLEKRAYSLRLALIRSLTGSMPLVEVYL